MSVRLVSSVLFALSGALVVTAFACGTDSGESEFDAGGEPDTGSSGSSGTSGGFPDGGAGEAAVDSGVAVGTLVAIIRDFREHDAAAALPTNPDFENVPAEADRPADAGAPYFGPWTEATPVFYPGADYPLDIVQTTLGADGTPQYNTANSFKGAAGRTATTHGKTFFDQWYHDTPGFNVVNKMTIALTKTGTVYSYDSAVSGIPLSTTDPAKGFFPIDDAGFGNEGRDHNYSFTVELHTKFKYKGDEAFKFSGDDDVFVFINKKLVINIGGIHSALTKEVELPDVASSIGLAVGQEYALDFFQAERHIVQSNLRIDTTLELVPDIVR